MEQLSPHFNLVEFVRSETAARLGLSNMPPASYLSRLKIVATGLEKIRTLFAGSAIHVSSGYRSPELNAHVPGSSNTSAHTLAWAADIEIAGQAPLDVSRAVSLSGIGFDQVIYEYGAWTHVSFDPRMRGELWTKTAGQPYRAGLHP